MAEFARALILPDLGAPTQQQILSLLLVWDGLEVELTSPGPKSEEGLEWATELIDAGLVNVRRRPFDPKYPPEDSKPFEKEWTELSTEILVKYREPGMLQRAAERAGAEVSERLLVNIEEAASRAAQLGLAPLAVTPFATLATCLPARDDDAPVTESTLIEVAARGIQVASDTDAATVIEFRERNAALMGRFRASLIDLAESIDANSPVVAAEQAYAVVRNRVEPALSKLEDALDAGRIRFAFNMLLGASAMVFSGVETGALVAEAGTVAARPIRYAFDRDRLVREHPYGLLYRAAEEFGRDDCAQPPSVITDPKATISQMITAAVHAAMEASVNFIDRNPAMFPEVGRKS